MLVVTPRHSLSYEDRLYLLRKEIYQDLNIIESISPSQEFLKDKWEAVKSKLLNKVDNYSQYAIEASNENIDKIGELKNKANSLDSGTKVSNSDLNDIFSNIGIMIIACGNELNVDRLFELVTSYENNPVYDLSREIMDGSTDIAPDIADDKHGGELQAKSLSNKLLHVHDGVAINSAMKKMYIKENGANVICYLGGSGSNKCYVINSVAIKGYTSTMEKLWENMKANKVLFDEHATAYEKTIGLAIDKISIWLTNNYIASIDVTSVKSVQSLDIKNSLSKSDIINNVKSLEKMNLALKDYTKKLDKSFRDVKEYATSKNTSFSLIDKFFNRNKHMDQQNIETLTAKYIKTSIEAHFMIIDTYLDTLSGLIKGFEKIIK